MSDDSKNEVLVVASKLKNYIKEAAGLSTSAAVIDTVSAKIKEMCDKAIVNAKNDKRKTVMDRDFE